MADSNLPVGNPRPLQSLPLSIELSDLQQAAEKHNQELLLATVNVEAALEKERLAELSFMPDFSVGGRYIVTDERNDANPSGNGNDPLILEVGFNLPIQRSAKHARVAEARHMTTAASFERQAKTNEIRAGLAEAYFKMRNQWRLLRLHEDVLLPQAERAAREAEASVASGNSGLSGLMETIAARYAVKIGVLRAQADYSQSITRLENLIGRPFSLLERNREEESRP